MPVGCALNGYKLSKKLIFKNIVGDDMLFIINMNGVSVVQHIVRRFRFVGPCFFVLNFTFSGLFSLDLALSLAFLGQIFKLWANYNLKQVSQSQT